MLDQFHFYPALYDATWDKEMSHPFPNPIPPGMIWEKNADFFIPVVSMVGSGPSGKSFTYEDFTEEQLQELREVVRSMMYRNDGDTVIPDSTTARIPIPFDDYNDKVDTITVDLDGFMLTEGVDYIIEDGYIVFLHQTVDPENRIGVHRMTAVAITQEEFEALRGEKGEKGDKGDPGEPGISGSYPGLEDKPSINNVTLIGDTTFADLGIEPITNSYIDEIAV